MTADDIFKKGALILENKRKDQLNQKQRGWELKHFVDEFQNETKPSYLIHTSNVVLSNSETTNAKLLDKLLMTDKNEVQLFLKEYGSSPVKGGSSSGYTNYTVKILQGDTIILMDGYLIDDRIFISDDNYLSS